MKIGLSIFVYITKEALTPDYKLYSSLWPPRNLHTLLLFSLSYGGFRVCG